MVSVNTKFIRDAISVLQKDLNSLYHSETIVNRIHGFLLLIGQLVLCGNVVEDAGFLIKVISIFIFILVSII